MSECAKNGTSQWPTYKELTDLDVEEGRRLRIIGQRASALLLDGVLSVFDSCHPSPEDEPILVLSLKADVGILR